MANELSDREAETDANVTVIAVILFALGLLIFLQTPNVSDPTVENTRSYLTLTTSVSVTLSGFLIAAIAFITNRNPSFKSLADVVRAPNFHILFLGAAAFILLSDTVLSAFRLAELTSNDPGLAPSQLANYVKSGLAPIESSVAFIVFALGWMVFSRTKAFSDLRKKVKIS